MLAIRSTISNLFASQRRPSFEIRQGSARWAQPSDGSRRRSIQVTEVIRETPSTATLVLDNRKPLSYQAGQHLTVLVDIDGVTYRRCYSLSTSPVVGDKPAITVKHIPDGVVSGFLHTQVKAGDTLRVIGPSGTFTISTDSQTGRRYVFVAGGVGITPLISLAETVLHEEPQSMVTLLYGNRDEEEIIFRQRLAKLTTQYAGRLTVHYALDTPPSDWDGIAGPLDGARVLEALGVHAADGYSVCGPEPMMDSVTAALRQAGIDRDHIRIERFAYAPSQPARRPSEPCNIVFEKSAKQVMAQSGQTILQAGLEAGEVLEYSCTMGGCGACKVRLKQGKVVMDEPNCLTPQETEAGYILPCCAYGEQSVVIEGR